MSKEPNVGWQRRGTPPRLVVPALALAVLLATQAGAISFGKGELTGTLDTTLSWGLSYRLEDRDPDIIGLPERGRAFSVNGDDGNLNYDTGVFSNVFKLTSELELNYKNLGGFLRYRAFYDYENEEEKRERTPLSGAALNRVGTRSEILDAFVWSRFDVGGRPAEVRLGEQVLSWGESTFIQGGINIINPVDVSALRVPGAELREALLPEAMVSVSLGTSTNTTLEFFYLLDWGEIRIDPPGSYFSTNDFAGDGGETVFLGFGDSPDTRTYPFTDRPFLGVPRSPDQDADDDGQYGAALRLFAPALNDTEFGFYFINYHSRLPTINGRTGTLAGALAARGFTTAGSSALLALSAGAARDQAILAGTLAGIESGLAPLDAGIVSTATVDTALAGGNAPAVISAFATDAYAQTASYFLAYPEDIKLYGMSFNTALGTYAIQGELAYRADAPYQVDDVELLFAALGPINPALAAFNQVGNFTGQFETPVPGIRLLDSYQFQTTVTKIFGPLMGADQGLLLWEGAITRVDLPDKSEQRFEGPGTYVSGNPILGPAAHAGKPIEPAERFADRTSWGYRLAGRLEYNNALAGFNVLPRFSWQHDVSGISPGPGGAFLEDLKALTLGLGFNRQNTWEIDLSYTTFMGAGRYNLVNDRDFAQINFKYSF